MDVDDILTKYSKDEDQQSTEQTKEAPIENKPEKKEFVRKKPSQWKLIKDIKKDDVRVRVVGIITSIDKEAGIITIDDGDSITIISTPEQVKDLEVGKKISVIGLVVPFSENIELRAEVISDWNKIDMVLYKKFMELMRGEGNV